MSEEASSDPIVYKIPDLPESVDELRQIVEYAYPWFDEKNKQEVLPYLQGLPLATQHNFTTQMKLYRRTIIEVFTRDLAERALEFISLRTGYQLELHLYPEDLSDKEFIIKIIALKFSWKFEKIKEFQFIIPLEALQIIKLLDESGIIFDDLWIATKLQHDGPSLPEYMLCAQFDRWFVEIDRWR